MGQCLQMQCLQWRGIDLAQLGLSSLLPQAVRRTGIEVRSTRGATYENQYVFAPQCYCESLLYPQKIATVQRLFGGAGKGKLFPGNSADKKTAEHRFCRRNLWKWRIRFVNPSSKILIIKVINMSIIA